jgi:Zn-dependent protease with chaperone function
MSERLKRRHFAHPLDLSGMQGILDGIVRVPLLGRELATLQRDIEDEFYLLNLADNLKLSARQGASMYGLVESVSRRFGIPTPNVFIDSTSEVSSYALGGRNPSLVFTSGLVDSFPEPATRAVIGHELGHVICDHTFYRLMAENNQAFSRLTDVVPLLGPAISFGIVMQLFDWYKKSELSADRAALLATEDLSAVQDYVLRTAGASSKLAPEVSLAEFGAQADEFLVEVKRRRQQNVGRRLRLLLSSVMLNRGPGKNPWPALRFKAISEWATSRQYAHLLAGKYDEAATCEEAMKDDELLLALELPTEEIKTYLQDLSDAAKGAVDGLFKQVTTPSSWFVDDNVESKDNKKA